MSYSSGTHTRKTQVHAYHHHIDCHIPVILAI